MKSKKLFNCLIAGIAIFSFVSCGEKQISRDEAKGDMTTISNKDVSSPTKYTYSSKSSGSSTINSLGLDWYRPNTTTTTIELTVTLSMDDNYFAVTVGDDIKVILFEKDNVLNLYTKFLMVETTAKVDISFTEELKELVEQYKVDLITNMKAMYKEITDDIMNQLDELSKTDGFEEKYTTTGDGNLSVYVKYSEKNTSTSTVDSYKTEFTIDNYFLTSLKASVNDQTVVDFSLQVNKADIVIPTTK